MNKFCVECNRGPLAANCSACGDCIKFTKDGIEKRLFSPKDLIKFLNEFFEQNTQEGYQQRSLVLARKWMKILQSKNTAISIEIDGDKEIK